MRILLLVALMLGVYSSQAQWNPNPIDNNPVVTTAQRGTSTVSSLVSASDGAGGMYVAWVDARNSGTTGNDIYITRMLADGNVAPGFTAGGLVVSDVTGSQSAPVLESDGAGGVVIAWVDPANGNDVYAQRINASGTKLWGASGVAVANTASVNETTPRLARVSNSQVAVVWRFTGTTTSTDLACNFLSLTDGSKAWATNTTIIALANAQSNQQVVADGNGGVIVVWTDGRNSSGTAGIVAQRINSSGAKEWATDGVILRSPTVSNTTAPQIVSDGAAGAVVAWSDSRNGSLNADIYIQRITASGTAEWTAEGVQVSGAAGQQVLPALTKSGNNFIVCWSDQSQLSSDNQDIFAQAFDLTGAKLWNGGNQLAVCAAAGNQPASSTTSITNILSDGAGGAWFIWDDRRNTNTNEDIYAQRITAAGALAWDAAGVPVASRTGSNQTSPVVAAGSGNTLIIAWRDSRTATSAEIYASLLGNDGILPVSLLSFTGRRADATALLQWEVSGEYGISSYEVQRGSSPTAFAAIGSLRARNEAASRHTYQFTDARPNSGDNYYRLKIMEQDGSFRYSEVVKVSFNTARGMRLSAVPNPTRGQALLQLEGLDKGQYSLLLTDATGRVLLSRSLRVQQSFEQQTLETGHLPSGIYRLVLSNSQGEVVGQLALQKQ